MTAVATDRGTGGSAPDVSVVIPLRDRAALVPQTLASLDPAHHPGVTLEIIVVDDGSTDDGPALIERLYPSVRLLLGEHRGAPAARNRGLEHATGTHVLLLDSDDLVEPGFFAPRLRALREHPTAAGAYGPWEHFVGTGPADDSRILPRRTNYPLERRECCDEHLERLLGGWYIPVHAVVWRTPELRRIGGQDESLLINQDVDMHVRILADGRTLVGCDAPRAWYRTHSGPRQGSSTSGEKHRQMLALRQRFATELQARGRFPPSFRSAMSRYCFHRWRELRRQSPEVADRFLALSRELDPALRVEGRLPLRLLGAALGAPRATILRDWFLER
jgi:GT2 family glycosyltransferase